MTYTILGYRTDFRQEFEAATQKNIKGIKHLEIDLSHEKKVTEISGQLCSIFGDLSRHYEEQFPSTNKLKEIHLRTVIIKIDESEHPFTFDLEKKRITYPASHKGIQLYKSHLKPDGRHSVFLSSKLSDDIDKTHNNAFSAQISPRVPGLSMRAIRYKPSMTVDLNDIKFAEELREIIEKNYWISELYTPQLISFVQEHFEKALSSFMPTIYLMKFHYSRLAAQQNQETPLLHKYLNLMLENFFILVSRYFMSIYIPPYKEDDNSEDNRLEALEAGKIQPVYVSSKSIYAAQYKGLCNQLEALLYDTKEKKEALFGKVLQEEMSIHKLLVHFRIFSK